MDSSFCEGFHALKRRFGAEQVLLFGKLIMFTMYALRFVTPRPPRALTLAPSPPSTPTPSPRWGLGIAWALWRILTFVKKTAALVALERSKASPQLIKRVKELVAKVDRKPATLRGRLAPA